jgi:hypothetical protein
MGGSLPGRTVKTPYRSDAMKRRLLRTVKDVWGDDTVDVVLQMTGNAIRMQQDLDKLYEDNQEHVIEMDDDSGKPRIIHRNELAAVVNGQWKQIAEYVVPKPKPIEVELPPDDGRKPALTQDETRARLLKILADGIAAKEGG